MHFAPLTTPEENQILWKWVGTVDSTLRMAKVASFDRGTRGDPFDVTTFFKTTAWTNHSLAELKARLNEARDATGRSDRTEWRRCVKEFQINMNLTLHLRGTYGVEMGTIGFAKCFELLQTFPLLNRCAAELTTVHLCEAPGAFVAATNHFMKTVCKPGAKWNWMGMTHAPRDEKTGRRSSIQSTLVGETMPHWCFGADDTGDVKRVENVHALCAAMERMFGTTRADLVTADGSEDCRGHENFQEERTAWLHYFEVLTAFHVLGRGGSFVLKMMTLFEASSQCLLYLLSRHFNRVDVCKPFASTPSNCEVYVVCTGFTPPDPTLLLALRNAMKEKPSLAFCALFPREAIDKEWIVQYIGIAAVFAELQLAALGRNLRCFSTPPPYSEAHAISLNRLHFPTSWAHRFGLTWLRHGSDRVVPGAFLSGKGMYVEDYGGGGDGGDAREAGEKRQRVEGREGGRGRHGGSGTHADLDRDGGDE